MMPLTPRFRVMKLSRLKSIILGVHRSYQSNLPSWNILQTAVSQTKRRCLSLRTRLHTPADSIHSPLDLSLLPVSCPGCGALTQWVYPSEEGFYRTSSRHVREYVRYCLEDLNSNGATDHIAVGNTHD